MDINKLLTQSRWRKIGAVTVVLATAMALYAGPGDILRDSVIHVAELFSKDVPDRMEPNRPLLFCAIYWMVFALLILVSLYMAQLDIRFIRLQYTIAKQSLFRQTMSEDAPPTENGQDGDEEDNK